VIPDPVVVIEVLSSSTVEHDRGRKAYDYRRIPWVQEIALVASEQRHVEIWRRWGAKWKVGGSHRRRGARTADGRRRNSVRRDLHRQRRLIRRARWSK